MKENYDIGWDGKVRAAHEILKSAADRYASDTSGDPDLNRLLAVLVHILGDSCCLRFENILSHDPKWSSSQWSQFVAELEIECGQLLPDAAQAQAPELADRLQHVVSAAATEWREGNPEDPPTSTVLNAIIGVLFENRMIKHPPNEWQFTQFVDWLASKHGKRE